VIGRPERAHDLDTPEKRYERPRHRCRKYQTRPRRCRSRLVCDTSPVSVCGTKQRAPGRAAYSW
jgi:hypothetical protein